MRVSDFVTFIKAREAHRRRREGDTTNFVLDPIINKFRFCNVRRNDDRVTKWVFANVLDPNRHHPDLWFALVVARLFNLPESLHTIAKHVLPFQPNYMRVKLKNQKALGHNVFNAAYIVSTNGHKMDKIDYVIDVILTPMWAGRAAFKASMRGATLEQVHEVLMGFSGLGSFMAAQVIADLKYADPVRWADFHTFASSGPGSRRGLNRVMGRPATKNYREETWRRDLQALRIATNKALRWPEPLTAHDIQNCLCEFDKYERARTGEGVPKQLYKPHVGD